MKSKNAHAWTELFLDRYGWIVSDATPEASNIQPGQTRVKNFSEDNFMALGDEILLSRQPLIIPLHFSERILISFFS